VMLYLYRFFFELFQPTVYSESSIWNTIVLNEPTVGRSLCRLIVLLFVLNTKVAFVRFYLSNPPKIRIEEGSIW
jgi:hypothetical protein